jgi:hypothetical protein
VRFRPTIPKADMDCFVRIPTNDADTPLFSLNMRGVVPVPSMVVTLDGLLVAPNSQVNMPATPVGQTSELELAIANLGERPLTLSAALDSSGGFGSQAFSIVQPATDTIAAGASATFAVRFSPTQTGAVTTNIGISTNDVGNFPNGRMTFVVRGVATAAQLDEPVDGLDDDNVSDESTDEQTGGPIENGGGQAGDDANADIDEDDATGAEDENNAESGSAEEECAQMVNNVFCGGGLGFAPLASLAGLAAFKRRRRA